jgi:hypothetical protein
MSKLQEIEQAVERLPLPEFIQFVEWIDQKRKVVGSSGPRDHSAFLSSYSPEDKGLYDDHGKAG